MAEERNQTLDAALALDDGLMHVRPKPVIDNSSGVSGIPEDVTEVPDDRDTSAQRTAHARKAEA
ncbi:MULTISPECIES: hypothetical protein [Alphaproteobacteria]|jgi:hypothetical protein|uniref:Uncharacterized protein n=2 Tax=Alphaproteobacteria TaxID=28211 RepID=A0A512HNF4_9HYPH|nr:MULTISPECIES: hypothetical protein [Alphaproteobacteria]GEO86959.1 hypothetical protein RNA01_38910 [Ciceribacter naphthalenivorans]GLR23301.1 hypothetical protein GCM10007920_30900 [Ciceribacter naphthalenivorans]GLT06157.1 hypothetical protein GCM10007926_30900 [Sphingomonas psychrolutea]